MLGEPAVPDDGECDHPPPDELGIDALSDGGDPTRDLCPGRERQRRLDLVLAPTHQHVGEVERRGGDLDRHLSGTGDRNVDLVELQDRGRLPELMDSPRAHPTIVSAGAGNPPGSGETRR